MKAKIPIEFVAGFAKSHGMQNKTVTVVGGTGFVGRYVVELLAKKGYLVRVIARDAESGQHIKTGGDVGQITLVSGDIAKPESLKGRLDHSFAVVNLAGILFETGRQKFEGVQARGAARLAELAHEAGAERFVHVSAIGADSASKSKYAKTKAAGENAVKGAFPQATILRPSVIFGAEDMFFNKFAAMARVLPFLPLIGGGKTKFRPVYVLDVAQAVLAVLERNGVQGRTFELGGPKVYSFRELLEFIGKTTGRRRALLGVPFGVASLLAAFTGRLPDPPLTRDQVTLLKSDNVVSGTAKKLADLGIIPQPLENIVPIYLARFARKLA